MTNRQRLNRMNTADYAKETAAFAACSVHCFVDYEAWLESSDPEYPIIGRDAVYDNGKRSQPCKCVGELTRSGKPHTRIILSLPGLHDFELLTVPSGFVKDPQTGMPLYVSGGDADA